MTAFSIFSGHKKSGRYKELDENEDGKFSSLFTIRRLLAVFKTVLLPRYECEFSLMQCCR